MVARKEEYKTWMKPQSITQLLLVNHPQINICHLPMMVVEVWQDTIINHLRNNTNLLNIHLWEELLNTVRANHLLVVNLACIQIWVDQAIQA
jgi:hypothetical protein